MVNFPIGTELDNLQPLFEESLGAILRQLSAALFGLAELAANARSVFVVVKWLGAGWLIFTGLRKLYSLRRVDTSRSVVDPQTNDRSEDYSQDAISLSDAVVGFALGLSNPVAIAIAIRQ